MPNFAFDWGDVALRKLSDNFVRPEEYERVVKRADEIEFSRSSGRPCCRGRVGNRVPFCIFEYIDEWRIKPINAFWIHED